MSGFIARIKTEPTIVVQALQALLGLLISFDVIQLSDNQTGAILSFVAAGLGLVLALGVRPFSWAVVTGFVQAGVVLVTSFGLELSSDQVANIYTVFAVLGAIIVRQSVKPETKLQPVTPASV